MASCKFPYLVKNPSKLAGFSTSETFIPVPCGKCYDCKMTIVSQWAFRIQEQEKTALTSLFVTLTYENPPISKNGFMTLVKSDLQKFFKRLRQHHKEKNIDYGPIKYFAVGEYGSKRQRPHYHIILLNAHPELVNDSWKLGFVDHGTVTGKSIAYTLKYVMKNSKIPQHSRDDRLKEFRVMSKKLGTEFLTESVVNYFKKSKKTFITMEGLYKIPLPRYYKNKIFDEVEIKKINFEIKKNIKKIESLKEKNFKESLNYKTVKDYERASAEYKNQRSEKRNDRGID